MKFLERIMNIDRRYLFLLIFFAVVIPLIFPLKFPVYITKEVKDVWEYIENLTPEDVVLLALDYDPATMAELQPMYNAILRHCFMNDVKVLATVFWPQGIGLAEHAIKKISREYNKKSGIDYVFLGYRPQFFYALLGMGREIRIPFPSDYYGTSLRDLPMMDKIHNFRDMDLIVSFAGSGVVMYWLVYAHEPYGTPLAWGVTAVMATDYYPYLQSRQLVGMLGGLKGAAEYEKLINHPDKAKTGMSAQTIAHIVILVFIVLGNLGFIATRRKKLREEKEV